MGMYTQFHLSVKVTEEPRPMLQYMLDPFSKDRQVPKIPNHLLFGDTRWEWMLRTGHMGDSSIDDQGNLIVNACFKNYDGEVQHFLNWIEPYLDAGNESHIVGYSHYEDHDTPKYYAIQGGCFQELEQQ